MVKLRLFLVLFPMLHACSETSNRKRTVMAWASRDGAGALQLRNASWAGIFDGVQAFCGVSFRPDGSGLDLDPVKWEGCTALHHAARDSGVEFHLCIEGKVPDHAANSPQPVIDAAMAIASEYGVNGFSLDDEYDCAPRSTLDHFERWMTYVDALAQGLHSAGLELSAAVQAMFGIQDVPYRPYCANNTYSPECSQACRDAPSSYPLEPRVGQLMSQSFVDRWLEMDTYYFTTSHFLNTMDWYVENVATEKLGVAMMNRDDLSEEGLLARFHAIDKSDVDWINIFLLPADDLFLPQLRRWKTRCAGCGVQSVLGCYDLAVSCQNEESVHTEGIAEIARRLQ